MWHVCARPKLDVPPGVVQIIAARRKEQRVVDMRRLVVIGRALWPRRDHGDVALLREHGEPSGWRRQLRHARLDGIREGEPPIFIGIEPLAREREDRKSTRLNS